MPEKLEALKNKFIEINNKYSKKTKTLVVGGAVALVVVALIITIILNNKPYEVLFPGLNEQEATEIMGKLQASGVDYKYENNGTILVPAELEAKLKAQLVSEGYPKSGFTYDVFRENINLMTTDFEKISYKIYDLQDRIAATICMFDGVKDATVTIAIGDEKKYVRESDKTETTATVVVIMEDGGSPTPAQVKTIQSLVAKSIPGTKFGNIMVAGGDGIEVSVDDSGSQTGVTRLKLDLEKEVENSIKSKILHILTPIFGKDKIYVAVRATMDLDKKIREIITYAPQEDGKGVISNEVGSQEVIRDGENAGGIPGTEGNANVPIYNGITTDGTELYYKNDQAFDYLVDQVKEQIQSDSGVLTDVTVSVTFDGQEMTAQQMQDLRDSIALTAGIPKEQAQDKIALLNAAFAEVEENGQTTVIQNNNTVLIVGGSVLAALLVAGIIMFIVLGKRKKKREQEALEAELLAAQLASEMEETQLMDLSDVKLSKEEELQERIREFADINPEIAAQLLKTWLKGGDE